MKRMYLNIQPRLTVLRMKALKTTMTTRAMIAHSGRKTRREAPEVTIPTTPPIKSPSMMIQKLPQLRHEYALFIHDIEVPALLKRLEVTFIKLKLLVTDRFVFSFFNGNTLKKFLTN